MVTSSHVLCCRICVPVAQLLWYSQHECHFVHDSLLIGFCSIIFTCQVCPLFRQFLPFRLSTHTARLTSLGICCAETFDCTNSVITLLPFCCMPFNKYLCKAYYKLYIHSSVHLQRIFCLLLIAPIRATWTSLFLCKSCHL